MTEYTFGILEHRTYHLREVKRLAEKYFGKNKTAILDTFDLDVEIELLESFKE